MGDEEGLVLRVIPLIAVAAACCAALPVEAADAPGQPPVAGWIVTLGVMPSVGARYEGAKLYGIGGSPVFDIRRADEAKGFSAPDDGFDFTLFSAGSFAVGPVFNVRGGRYRSADRSLLGLRDVPWTIESGVFAEFWPLKDRLRTRIEVRHGFRGRSDGFVGDLSVDWVERFGALTLSAGPRLSVGDADYMDANYGVLPSEAAANRRVNAFDAGPGLKSVGVAAALSFDWSSAWTSTAFVRYDRLTGDAARSPIVKRFGSRDQVTVGTGLSYSFAIGD